MPASFRVLLLTAPLLWVAGGAIAQQQLRTADGIYSCTDAKGRRLTSDRPIIECLDREQRVLNKDGSTRTTLPPSMTADERAAIEEAQRAKALEEEMRKETVRHDRNLLNRYPDQAAHDKARSSALDNLRTAIRLSEKRLKDLERDRKPLLDESEFYKGREMPAKLRAQFDYIQVATEAQRTLVQNQQADLTRLNNRYDDELIRLKKLWAGAQPGTVGPVPTASAR